MSANKLCPDDFRDIREALVMQDPIDIVPAFCMPCLGFLGLFIFSLQLLQPQFYATNASLIRSFKD